MAPPAKHRDVKLLILHNIDNTSSSERSFALSHSDIISVSETRVRTSSHVPRLVLCYTTRRLPQVRT